MQVGEKLQKPLSSQEITTLWAAERRGMRYFVFALTILAAGLGLASITDTPVELRYLMTLVALALIAAALVSQLSIRCPRCKARLATQSLMLLPDTCKSCGVEIVRLRSLDSELDV